jgi:DNA repair exonuclease SbcCD ATPase subunit
MRRASFCVIALLAISGPAVGQTDTPEVQTLQALLSEVRALRQELRVSLNRTQTMQILLVRFQMQEGAIARASDRVNDARQRLLETQVHQKELTAEAKRLQDALDSAQNQQQQADLQDRIKQIKSQLEIIGNLAQQRQTVEIQAEQQLRDEQDKLSALEGQLDGLIRAMGSSVEQSPPTK